MRKFIRIATFFVLMLIFSPPILAETGSKVYVIDIDREIGSATWRFVQNGMNAAKENKSDVIILHINTYGGAVADADSIRTRILNSSIPVVAFIDNNAASAGALISLACDSIYMRKGANIGAATVVDEKGDAMPDKYQSYMRAMMRATAESHGRVVSFDEKGDSVVTWRRNPLIAEAMVDPRTVVKEIGDDSTRVVTFTTDEALKYNFCDGTAENINEVVQKQLKLKNYTIATYEPTIMDRLMGFLTNPAFQAILIMIIIGGIYFELQTPGMGFPSVAAVLAALLYFAPLYLEGIAAGWEVIAFMVGVILLLLEIFVIPGFGITGISGIILIFASLFCALLGNDITNFELITSSDIMNALLIVFAGFLLGVVMVIFISHKIGSRGIMRDSALQKEQNIDDGYIGVPVELARYVGMKGTSVTVLRLSGKIKIGDDVLDAVSMHDFIDAGVEVKVVKYENTQLYVERIQ